MAGSEDDRLIARCRRGDREAQEALVRRHQGNVYGLACSLLGNREDALDAAQEALVAMLRSLPRFRGESRFQTWLYRITVNTCIMQRRRLKVRTRIISDLPAEEAQAAQDWELEPRVMQREAQAAVREHLRRLPSEYRAAIVLREFEGMSYEEVAETLQVPIGTVQSRLSRGRQMLRAAMLKDERIPKPQRGGEVP